MTLNIDRDVTGLAPGGKYTMTQQPSGGGVTVTVTPSGPKIADSAGVIHF
jgi:hypothetical protein